MLSQKEILENAGWGKDILGWISPYDGRYYQMAAAMEEEAKRGAFREALDVITALLLFIGEEYDGIPEHGGKRIDSPQNRTIDRARALLAKHSEE